MGFYVSIGRTRGPGEIPADAIADSLNLQDYLEHVKTNEWWSPGGILTLVRDRVDEDFDGAYISCRFSWATPPQVVSDILHTYITLAEELGMIVTLVDRRIERENVSEITGRYFAAAETAKDLLGTVTRKRQPKAGPPRLERGDRKYQEKLEKIRKRDFEFLPTIAYLLCMQCGFTMEVSDKFKRNIEAEFGIKVEGENQFYQTERCFLCRGDLPEVISVEEIPLN